ncbi:MAG: hypothetical protein LBE14_05710 [Treponema sp.]|jgi:hypothetical protein|nr:hypothetical protein [Treponema sp.]
MRKKACVIFLLVASARIFPEESAGRLLNILEGVLSTAVESNKSPPAQSPGQPPDSFSFYLLNKTGFTVKEVYVTQSTSDTWGAYVFQGHLYQGQTILITLDAPLSAEDQYNIRLVDTDGDHYSKYNVSIAEYGIVEVGISEYDQ